MFDQNLDSFFSDRKDLKYLEFNKGGYPQERMDRLVSIIMSVRERDFEVARIKKHLSEQ